MDVEKLTFRKSFKEKYVHVWVNGHLQDIAGDMCQDLHFVMINTILCFTCGTGCDFVIFEMPFHSNCILILHYYLKWAEKSFEKYNCLICEQHFVNSTIFSRFLCARLTKIKGTPKSKKVKWIFDLDWKRPWNESPTRAIFTHFQS